METSIVIVFVVSVLVGWIAWLIYLYNTQVKSSYSIEESKYWYQKYHNLQLCVNDLIKVIRQKFPESTIKYIMDDNDDSIEGEIKY